MTTPTPPRYATIEDYELRTGIDVPPDQEATVQQRLDDYAALMAIYMGPCADEVEATYPDVLTALNVAGVQRSLGTVPGVRSESVGATSVSYLDLSSDAVAGVYGPEREVLDALMAACCPSYNPGMSGSIGMLGVGRSGGRVIPADELWVVSRW